MKHLYYLALVGIMMVGTGAMASGVPVYGWGEVINQTLDNGKGDYIRDLVETHKRLVNTTLDAVGSPETFSASSLKKNLKDSLTDMSEAVTGQYEGLQNVLGEGSEYGRIAIAKCGKNIEQVAERLNETVTYPAKEADRLKMTTAEKNKRAQERAVSMERAATSGLAKAWLAQSETANVAEAIADTQKELDNAESQQAVLATLMRLQEETQKNINTRLSLMGDDLISTGLVALEGNI
ncbi:MAG: hypothetical protein IJV07_05130 [Alphaproteobacteria bacterium]|nr:hypothetical protein [Alphaproteobacteria bacterium]